jgi:hypothetical protein
VLLVLAMPVASIAWTVTHEDIFKETRDYCARRSREANSLLVRKAFYLVTCEYCFSHWVTIGVLVSTGFRLLYDDWRGVVIGGFSLVWVANHYMSVFGRLRLGIRSERIEVSLKEKIHEQVADTSESSGATSARPLRSASR